MSSHGCGAVCGHDASRLVAAGAGGGARGGTGSRPQSAERAQSPGRALAEVKKKLSEYVTKRSSAGAWRVGRSRLYLVRRARLSSCRPSSYACLWLLCRGPGSL